MYSLSCFPVTDSGSSSSAVAVAVTAFGAATFGVAALVAAAFEPASDPPIIWCYIPFMLYIYSFVNLKNKGFKRFTIGDKCASASTLRHKDHQGQHRCKMMRPILNHQLTSE